MTYTPPADQLAALRSRALIVGGVGLALCVLGFLVSRDHFFRAWLISYMLFLGIALGSMALMMVQHLSGGQWGVFRRIFEASSRTLPLLLVLFLPLLFGLSRLYPWANPELVARDEVLHHRAVYLNTTFWIVRAAIYFGGWLLLAATLNRLSRRQDTGDLAVNRTIQKVCGAGVVFYGLSITWAAIDWLMALDPHWYSSLFGFLIIGGQGLSALSFTIIVATLLYRTAPMNTFLKPSHFHDLGKLSLAFVMLWAYFNFSQFLLTYAANLVEEIPYMVTRTHNGWQFLALFLVIFHFAVPFALLLSRDLKRTARRLVYVSLWILFARLVDLFMMVAPQFAPTGQNLFMAGGEHGGHIYVHWLDLAAPLGIGGIWVWMFFTELAKRPLLAVGDPYLRESLQSSGGH
jgi:hypothetical protein